MGASPTGATNSKNASEATIDGHPPFKRNIRVGALPIACTRRGVRIELLLILRDWWGFKSLGAQSGASSVM